MKRILNAIWESGYDWTPIDVILILTLILIAL